MDRVAGAGMLTMRRIPGQASLFGGIEPARHYSAPRQISPKPAGYAAPPGTGPAGETCGSCVNCRVRTGAVRRFYKCALMVSAWTHVRDSDVLLKSPACRRWSAGAPTETHIDHLRNRDLED